MGDVLLELSKNPGARKAIRMLGLPLPLPEVLSRARGPWEDKPLQGSYFVAGVPAVGRLTEALATTLARAGANTLIAGDPPAVEAFQGPNATYGTDAHRVYPSAIAPKPKLDGLIFDGSGIADVAGLGEMYEQFHALVGHLRASGRMIVLGTPPSAFDTAPKAAAQQALDGFVRSLAKEVGKKGTTANLVQVEPGAEARLEGVLRFMASNRSAFVTGQSILVRSRLKQDGELPWVKPLDGKVAVVTGAARGIGAATVEVLANEGAHVVCLDRPEDEGYVREVAEKFGGSTLLVDVTDPGAPGLIAERLKDKHGGLDVIVHNAGITRDRTLARMKRDRWDQVLDVNLASVIRINDRLLDGVLRDGGRIVCLSSMAGIAGNLGQTNYTASKAGVIGYVRHLAEALADRGIGVNAVAPGFIETRMTAAIPVAIRQVGRRLSSLSQGGLPRDVGEVITFLSTPASWGMTGTVLRVCGGSFLGA